MDNQAKENQSLQSFSLPLVGDLVYKLEIKHTPSVKAKR